MDPDNFREDLLRGLMTQAVENYKENSRIAALIEDKAQKCAALAGVFLAAGFAFLKKENFDEGLLFGGTDTLLLLALAIAALICCIGFCLSVLWVRKNPSPLSVTWLYSIVEDLMARPNDKLTLEVQNANRWLMINTLEDKLRNQVTGNEDRAVKLKVAQFVLSLAIALVAMASLSILFKVFLSRVASTIA